MLGLRSKILQRVLISHGTFERDEGISSFAIVRGNWKASSEETRLRHARVMRDFPSQIQKREDAFFSMKSRLLTAAKYVTIYP